MPKATKKLTYKAVTAARAQSATSKKSVSKKSSVRTAMSTSSSVAGDTEPTESVMDVDNPLSCPESRAGTEISHSSDEDDPEKQLRMSFTSPVHHNLTVSLSVALQKTWRSPVYNFFKRKVLVQYHDGRLCHFFQCTACSCKSSVGGIQRYQDSKDKASTANLKAHAIKCFGEEAVKIVTSAKDVEVRTTQLIFVAFAHQGQVPRNPSLHPHTNLQACAHIVKWVTENNWPINIINDQSLRELLTAGQPHLSLPGQSTIMRDIKVSYLKCQERITKLLLVRLSLYSKSLYCLIHNVYRITPAIYT